MMSRGLGLFVKQPLKQMTLRGTVHFNPDVKGLVENRDKERVAYVELMGHEPPISESPQWAYTGRKKADRAILSDCAPISLGAKWGPHRHEEDPV